MGRSGNEGKKVSENHKADSNHKNEDDDQFSMDIWAVQCICTCCLFHDTALPSSDAQYWVSTRAVSPDTKYLLVIDN